MFLSIQVLKGEQEMQGLTLLAWSKAISSSLISASNFFFSLSASALPFASASKLACMESRARWWFFLQDIKNPAYKLSVHCSCKTAIFK
jgi:hypothetical protein